MEFDDRIWELFSSAPGIALALVMFFVFMRTIKNVVAEHNEAYKANIEVLKENGEVIGECSAVLRDCRDALRDLVRRSA